MKLLCCNKCKTLIQNDNQIGVVVGIKNYRVSRAYIRPSKKLLEAASAEECTEYFPITFEKEIFGEIDLCTNCFGDFIKLGK